MNILTPSGKPFTKLTSLTFDELEIGQSASITRVLTQTDINLFATMSGNMDPIHFSGGPSSTISPQPLGYGMWAAALFSGLLGTQLPGPGTVYLKQDLKFLASIPLGTTVTATITITSKKHTKNGYDNVVLDCICVDQNGMELVKGVAHVIPPTEHYSQDRHVLPELQFIAHDQLDQLTAKCANFAPLPTAMVFPCDPTSLETACRGATMGLIKPVLVGPEARIREIAAEHKLDISPFRLVDALNEMDASKKGVALAKNGEVSAVMKGALHTDEFMSAIVKRDTGLRTHRRISHVFVMSVPTYPKPLLITDGVVNIAPNCDDKAQIIRNAIELANILGVKTPKVAILSAIETVNMKIVSTVDAAALCKMADRGQIKGAILDGPLAFDNAISKQAALAKGIVSEVAGDPDILLAPELASANMLVKQLSFLAHGDAAGLVLGASVPIILTSRADSLPARLASCALAVLVDAHMSDK